jgi:microcystin-dependent protein
MPTEGAGSISELNSAAPTATGPAGEGDDELRQLKTVLLASFPALDGLITNTGATGGAGDTDPPDAATFSKLFEDVRAALGSSSAVPVGAIVMWAGTEAQIPTGWALCNGLNATPDLRDRFILGADEANSRYSIGQLGGANWDDDQAFPVMFTADGGNGTGQATLNLPDHVITEANLPEHSHKLFGSQANSSVGGTQVGATEAATVDGSGHSNNNQPYKMAAVPTNPGTVEPDLARSSKYGTASPAGLSHPPTDVTIDGIVHSHAYLPAFYALAFIQFKGV